MPTNLGETIYQDHEVTSVLGITGMAITMADREQEQLEQEENHGEIHGPGSKPEEAENLTEENRQLRNQVAEVYQHIKMYQENSDSTNQPY
jgi:ABC-type polar amino acid transport system ATPase subunit